MLRIINAGGLATRGALTKSRPRVDQYNASVSKSSTEHSDQYRELVVVVRRWRRFQSALAARDASGWSQFISKGSSAPNGGISRSAVKQKAKTRSRQEELGINQPDKTATATEQNAFPVSSHKPILKSTPLPNLEVKSLTDEFCARLFATSGFSEDAVIKFLRTRGVQTLGHLSLRQIAIENESSKALLMYIDVLNLAGISVEPSYYSSLVLKLAQEGQDSRLRSIVTSDIHPSDFSESLVNESFPHALSRTQQSEEHVRTHIQKYITSVSDSREQGTDKWTADGMSLAVKNCLQSLMPDSQKDRHVNFRELLRAFLRSSQPVNLSQEKWSKFSVLVAILSVDPQSTVQVHARSWRKTFSILGDNRRLNEVEQLVLKIANSLEDPGFAEPRTGRDRVSRTTIADRWNKIDQANERLDPRPLYVPRDKAAAIKRKRLERLLTEDVIKNFIIWGFPRKPNESDGDSESQLDQPNVLGQILPEHLKWTWGIRLARTLKDDFNIGVSTSFVRKIILDRIKEDADLLALFRSSNPYIFDIMRKQVNNAWGDEVLRSAFELH